MSAQRLFCHDNDNPLCSIVIIKAMPSGPFNQYRTVCTGREARPCDNRNPSRLLSIPNLAGCIRLPCWKTVNWIWGNQGGDLMMQGSLKCFGSRGRHDQHVIARIPVSCPRKLCTEERLKMNRLNCCRHACYVMRAHPRRRLSLAAAKAHVDPRGGTIDFRPSCREVLWFHRAPWGELLFTQCRP